MDASVAVREMKEMVPTYPSCLPSVCSLSPRDLSSRGRDDSVTDFFGVFLKGLCCYTRRWRLGIHFDNDEVDGDNEQCDGIHNLRQDS